MGRFVTLDGGATGPAIHVADPPTTLDALAVDPLDVWRAQPEVRKVVDFIARNLASIPLHVYTHSDGGRERVRDGELVDMLTMPAPSVIPYRFWHTLHVDGLLFDRWCFVPLAARDGEAARLFRIPPGRFRVLRDDLNAPQTVIVWPKGGGEYRIPASSTVLDSGYATGWNNVTPPIETLIDTLMESSEARAYRRDLFKNGARIQAVIERPADAEKWDDASWNRFKSQFATYKQGGGQAGGTPILEDGMTYKAVDAFDPDKLDVLTARQLTAAEVAAFWHVPPEMVGARQGTFANLDAFRQMLWTVTLGPLIVAWEQALNGLFLPLVGAPSGTYIEAHVDAKLRGSFLEQAAAMQSSIGAPWMTRNEGRRMRNLPDVEGGDELITPLNVLVGGLASPRDTAPKGAVGAGKARGRAKASRPDDLPDAATARAAFLERVSARWDVVAGQMLAELNLKAMPDIAGVLDAYDLAAEFEPIIRAEMLRLAQIGAWDVLAEWNPEADGWGPEMIEGWIAKAAATNARRIASGVHNGMVDAVTDTDEPEGGLRSFLESDALLLTLAGVFAAEALGFGGHDAATKSGLRFKTWVVTSRNPRPSHAAQSGQTVAIDDVFANGLRWPGDNFGTADDNAGCTCELIYERG